MTRIAGVSSEAPEIPVKGAEEHKFSLVAFIAKRTNKWKHRFFQNSLFRISSKTMGVDKREPTAPDPVRVPTMLRCVPPTNQPSVVFMTPEVKKEASIVGV